MSKINEDFSEKALAAKLEAGVSLRSEFVGAHHARVLGSLHTLFPLDRFRSLLVELNGPLAQALVPKLNGIPTRRSRRTSG